MKSQKKMSCPISRQEFQQSAQPLEVKIGDMLPMLAEVREFSTSSFGWNANTKGVVEIAGKRVSVTINMNMIVVGSKEAN